MLKPFLSSLADESTRKTWAATCGTSLGHLRNCIYSGKPLAPETCVMVERNSGNRVRRWHLRPNDWHRIWPELIGAQGAPIVAQQHQTVTEAAAPELRVGVMSVREAHHAA